LTARSSGDDDAWVPTAAANGVELWYETYGDPDDPSLLLVSGLGSQATHWDVDLIHGFVDRGFHVIRFDNRDVGLSTKVESPGLELGPSILQAMQGEPVDAPYRLTDMAADVVGLLDHLGIESAHVVGASMGGMIAQTVAIEHPQRVRTLTSIMSTTGERDRGLPTPDAGAVLIRPAAKSRDEAIASYVETWRIIGTQSEWDEDRVRARGEVAYDRSYDPAGTGRQLLGILASGSRADALRALEVPTLVIHGTADPLVGADGGKRTAELIPGADLLLIEDMGHDLPAVHWPQVIEAITAHAGKVEAHE
jgi:pimeloyl-ACP methyl ester carboxylesterase